MKLDDWRNNPALVSWMRSVMSHPNWGAAMDCLREEHPKNYQSVGTISADRELGIIYGYDRFLNNLEAMGSQAVSYDMTEPEFAPEKQP